MRSSPAHGADHGLGESGRPLRALAASPSLIVLLLGALALRLTIAYVLFPASGFETDVSSYASWALTLAQHGAAGFYANAGFSDYPPAYLFVLWPVGLLANAVGPEVLAGAVGLVKLPPILLDLAVGALAYRLVLGWTWPSRRAGSLAMLAAALYLFNPVTAYDSALWGQTDSAGALIILLGVAALVRGNSEGAAMAAVVAALVKPQFGVVLIPLVVVMLVLRHLVRPGTGPRHRPWAPDPLRGWLASHQGPSRLLASLLVALGVFHLIGLPFGIGIREYLELMARTAGSYAFLTVNAFNGWALVGSGGSPPLSSGLAWSDDTVPLLGPLPGVAIGAALLAAGYLWTLARAAARDDRWTIIVAATVLCVAFFALPTRVHERYVFPAFALLPLLAAAERRWLVALVLLATGAFINLHGILTLPLYGSPNVDDLPLGAAFRSGPAIILSAILQTGVLAWAALRLRPAVVTSPDAFEREAASARPIAPTRGGWRDGPRVDPGPVAEPMPARPGIGAWLRSRIVRPPVRRDRSADLAAEPRGRLDRMDLFVVVLLAVAALTVRGHRLEQPVGMYFDEQYHARTATEFLQHWRFGQRHDIYEYTHPHLAKYAMALSIDLVGGNRVTATSELGVPVVDAAIEPRWGPGERPAARLGDRLYVTTGSELRAYDLATRRLVLAVPFASSTLALDVRAHRLYLADPDGLISSLSTTTLDPLERPTFIPARAIEPFAATDGPIEALVTTDGSVVIADADGRLSTFDSATGELTGERRLDGVSDLEAVTSVERIVVDPATADGRTTAVRLAELIGDDEERLVRLLERDASRVVLAAWPEASVRGEVQAGIDDGSLPGVSLETGSIVAVATGDGVRFLDARTLDEVGDVPTSEPIEGLAFVAEGFGDPLLYAAGGTRLHAIPFGDAGPGISRSLQMPGPVEQPLWNESARLVHVSGTAPDGGPTVYVVEPRGDSVFADAALPFEPMTLAMDTQPDRPAADRGQLLALAADGSVASVDVLGNAFAWRLPGMLLGVLGTVLLYLLARVLFARRSVGVLAAALALTEGMLFANSRIAMNDVYVTTFVLAAVLVFGAIHVGAVRRTIPVVLALLAAGLLLGLGLSSKWVALYAVGGLVLLLLYRSALGRIIALAGTVALTAVLGALAIRPAAADPVPDRNWAFLVLAVGVCAAMAAIMVRRPIRLTRGEVWLVTVGLVVTGMAILAGSFLFDRASLPDGFGPVRLQRAGALIFLGGLAVGLAAAVVARRRGTGWPPAEGPAWSQPGRRWGLGWLFALCCLGVLPSVVYVASYAPWIALGNQWLAGIPVGNTGQTLIDLTISMYEYHDHLRASHAAASPWWAWPLDLKPVWFYQESFAGPTTGLIYDAGNLVVFWMGIVGLAFATWAAWRRRSAALALILVCWAVLWLPWVRIDRATFQYHVYASLPFMVLALAYLLAELWHGPSPRAWALARAGAALAFVGAPMLWLLRTPLCLAAGTAAANPSGQACGVLTRTAVVSEAAVASLAVLGCGAAIVLWLLHRAASADAASAGPAGWRWAAPLPAVAVVGVATGLAVLSMYAILGSGAGIVVTATAEQLAVAALLVLCLPALLVLRARDSRRFVVGVLGAAALWLLLWYPNISGMPLPSSVAHVYQGLLPTWNYDFQFAVNTSPATSAGLLDASTFVVGLFALAAISGTVLVARAWRDTDPGGTASP